MVTMMELFLAGGASMFEWNFAWFSHFFGMVSLGDRELFALGLSRLVSFDAWRCASFQETQMVMACMGMERVHENALAPEMVGCLIVAGWRADPVRCSSRF